MNAPQRNYSSSINSAQYGRMRYPLQAAYGGYIPPVGYELLASFASLVDIVLLFC